MTEEYTTRFDWWKLISIILILIALLVGGYFYRNYEKNKSFTQGAQYGQLTLISNINSKGEIPIVSNSSGNITIQSIPIKQICQNLMGSG